MQDVERDIFLNRPKRILWLVVLVSACFVLTLAGFWLFRTVSLYLQLTRDYNPPIGEMREYYNVHRKGFERAAQLLLEQQCSYLCETPEEVLAWAGSRAELYRCNGREEPPMYDIITEGGTFTYIPDRVSVPKPWRPCLGVVATCSDRIADSWFRCKRSID